MATTKPVWRLPYTYPKQQVSEMLKEIFDGTSTLKSDMRREILIQAKECGLIEYHWPDNDVHNMPFASIAHIPQPEIQRGKH